MNEAKPKTIPVLFLLACSWSLWMRAGYYLHGPDPMNWFQYTLVVCSLGQIIFFGVWVGVWFYEYSLGWISEESLRFRKMWKGVVEFLFVFFAASLADHLFKIAYNVHEWLNL